MFGSVRQVMLGLRAPEDPPYEATSGAILRNEVTLRRIAIEEEWRESHRIERRKKARERGYRPSSAS